jgi:RimJ/RimL family protein N-acetyltransferase
MIRLAKDQYSLASPLLAGVPFNVLMAQAVAEGRVGGVVLADAMQPTSVYVRHKYGMSFLMGYSSNAGFREEIVAMFSDPTLRSSPEWLQVYPLDWTELLDPVAEGGKINRWRRTNFWFNQARFLVRFPRGASRYDTVVCTSAALDGFPGTVLPAHFWDDVDEFLASGTGFFSLDDGSQRVAAIAFASYLDEEFLEIGVETIPEFRGRGHARAACARLIHLCLERGLTPVWSCRTENQGSYRLAESLGLVPVVQLPYYELPCEERA